MGETSARYWQRWRDTTDSSTEQGLEAELRREPPTNSTPNPLRRARGHLVRRSPGFGRSTPRQAVFGRSAAGPHQERGGATPALVRPVGPHHGFGRWCRPTRLCACCAVCFGTRRTSRSTTWRTVSGSPGASVESEARPAHAEQQRHEGNGRSDAVRLSTRELFEGFERHGNGPRRPPLVASRRWAEVPATRNVANPRIGSGVQQTRDRLCGATRQGGEKPRRRNMTWRLVPSGRRELRLPGVDTPSARR